MKNVGDFDPYCRCLIDWDNKNLDHYIQITIKINKNNLTCMEINKIICIHKITQGIKYLCE